MPLTIQVPLIDARQKCATELQAVLVDLIDLSLQGKHAHWNVVGPQFRTLHLHLDELVDDVHKWSDEVAERLRALGVAADGLASVVARDSGLESLPEGLIDDQAVLRHVTDQLATASTRARGGIERLDVSDKVSEDILIEVVAGLEKHLWMFRSQQV
jgi:starvation-inducible DNA-binding protein